MSGPSIAGGGAVAVDTAEMRQAAATVDRTAAALDDALGVMWGAGWDSPDLAQAATALRTARDHCRDAADGLRIAADRYGTAEAVATSAVTTAGAALAAGIGGMERSLLFTGGPVAVLVFDGWLVAVAAADVGIELVRRYLTTGHVDPQLDPVLIAAVKVALSSLDDRARGFLGIEEPGDLLRNDPSAPFGSQQTAAVLGSLFGLLHPASSGLRYRSSRAAKRVDAPADLAALVGRIPDAKDGGAQVRIERYGNAGDRRWIVYIAGTATFAGDSGTEPFDMTSNLMGIAHAPSESETAVVTAMSDAGVHPNEPVLLVGHSQGALDAVRVAQDGGFTVGGVVQVGGPTGQIALPADVPVLAAEHDQDLVPALGGLAAAGTAGLNRVVVRRSLPDSGREPGLSSLERAFPAHRLQPYQETLREAQASGDPRVQRFLEQERPFLDGRGGTVTRVRADRVPAPAPAPAPVPSEPWLALRATSGGAPVAPAP